MSRLRLLMFCLFLPFAFPSQLVCQSIFSIQRVVYGSPLIDSVPLTQFPRGGWYQAVIQGSGLVNVTSFITSDPNVSGFVTSVSDTQVTVSVGSTSVKDGDKIDAPIPNVSFALLDSSQNYIPSPATFDIVTGPPPQVLSWKITNSVVWVPGGVETTVTYQSTILDSGNIQFFYLGGPTGGQITSWSISGTQFQSVSDLTIDVTVPVDYTFTNWGTIYGAVDGAGQGGTTDNDPLDPSPVLNLPAVQMQFVDPVPALLNGPAVTSDPTLLATAGTVVQGAAADGVTQLVVRVAGAPPSETFSLQVAQDGQVADIGSSSFQSNIPALQADSSGNAFFLYRAPLDFARPGGGDDGLPSRTIDLNFQSVDNPGVIGDTQATIVRPPVVLVHGNWSSAAEDWRYFAFANNSAVPDLFTVDYSSVMAQGVNAASRFILPQLQNVLQIYKSGAPTSSGPSVPVAAVQADLVAYSLGGLVSRSLMLQLPFKNSSNYGLGYVHKLITLDTPHQGAELATKILASNPSCRLLFAALAGPVQQNIQDMAPGSASLKALASRLPGFHLPTAVIVSIASTQQTIAADVAYYLLISGVCPNLLPTGGYQALFTTSTNPTGASDLIVSTYSQVASSLSLVGTSSTFPIPKFVFQSVIHDANPALFPLGPDVRQINLTPGPFWPNYFGVPPPFPSTEQVLQLLNTPVSQFGLIRP